jgi:hypothetical protein
MAKKKKKEVQSEETQKGLVESNDLPGVEENTYSKELSVEEIRKAFEEILSKSEEEKPRFVAFTGTKGFLQYLDSFKKIGVPAPPLLPFGNNHKETINHVYKITQSISSYTKDEIRVWIYALECIPGSNQSIRSDVKLLLNRLNKAL